VISAKVLGKQVERFVIDNAPGILTGVGVVGAVSTAFLTGKATFKATELLTNERERRYRMDEAPMETKDKIQVVWIAYLPPAGALGVTVTAIICANRISTGRVAALATAYSLSEKRFGEYREKIAEKFNPTKERQVRDEIAQDRVNANPPSESQIVIAGNGDVICHDRPTGRYFKSNMEKMRSLQNDINAEVNEVGYSPLSFLYQGLGLSPTPYSDQLGWTTSKMLNLQFSAVLTTDNQPCISIDYDVEPLRSGFPKGCDADPPF
jgi:hypothetical protein